MKPLQAESGVTGDDLTFLTFQSGDHPSRDRLDACNDHFGSFFDAECPNTGIDDFQFDSRAWLSGRALFGHLKGNNCTIHKSSILDWQVVGLRVLLDGELRGVVADCPFNANVGDVVIFDFSKSSTFAHNRSNQIAITIPKEEIGYDCSIHDPIIRIKSEDPEAISIKGYLNFVFNSASTLNSREAELASTALYGMLFKILNPDKYKDNYRHCFNQAKFQSIKHYLDSNVTCPMIESDMICQNFGVSRSTLFRLFRKEGGVDNYLKKRRLDRAYVDLTMAPPEKGVVCRIAAQYSFCDVAHFSNAFCNQFGFRPSEILGMRIRSDASRVTDLDAMSKSNSFEAIVRPTL